MKYILLLLLAVVSYCFTWAQTSLPTVVAAEYFVDDYVDFGKGQPLAVTPGGTVNISATLNLSLSPGTHRLYFRVRNNEGIWSNTYSRLFYQPAYLNTPSIVGFEYFVDDHVDFGKGTFVAMEADSNVYPIAMPDGLAIGVHVLYTRTKSSVNQWSHTTKRLFLVPDSTEIDNIVLLDYYYTDSLGNNPTSRFTYDDFESAPSVVLREEGLVAEGLVPGGTYLIHVRAFTEKGKITPERSAKFTVPAPSKPQLSVITGYENCLGTATLSVSGLEGDFTYSLDNESFQEGNQFTGLSAGAYTAYVISEGITYEREFTITEPDELILSEPIIQEPVCPSDQTGSIEIVASGGAGSGYEYSIDEVNYVSNGVFSGLPAGTYRITARDANGCSASLNVPVTSSTGGLSNPVIRRSSESDFVDELSLIVENVPSGATIQWFRNETPIPGATRLSTPITESGSYYAEVNLGDCSAISNQEVITGLQDVIAQNLRIYPVPAQEIITAEIPLKLTSGEIQATLMNAQGRVLEAKSLSSIQARQQVSFDVSRLPTGLYLLSLQGEGFQLQKRITKQ